MSGIPNYDAYLETLREGHGFDAESEAEEQIERGAEIEYVGWPEAVGLGEIDGGGK